MQRPTGISVLAIAILINAVLRFIISFLDMAIGSSLSAMAVSPGYIPPQYKAAADAIGDLGFWIGLFGMATAVLLMIAVRGLWTVSRWGWWLSLIVLAIALILNIIPLAQGVVTMRLALQTIVDVAFIVYLLRPHVRALFRGPATDVSAPA
jgi:hypothetical protein